LLLQRWTIVAVQAAGQGPRFEHGPAMLSLVLAMTPLRFAWVPGYADYYPEAPGGLAAGRSIEPVPFDGRVLGAELAHLGRPYLPSPVAITQAEYRWLSLGPRHPRAIAAGVRVAGRAARTRLLVHRMLSLGQALAAGLRAGLLASGVPVWLDTPMTGLEVRDGRVSGVRVTRGGEPSLIRARRDHRPGHDVRLHRRPHHGGRPVMGAVMGAASGCRVPRRRSRSGSSFVSF
jgi:3-oxosteroid 1-dehydrogenase